MAKVTYSVKVSVELSETTEELKKVAAREVIAGINTSLDHNENVEDIEVTAISAEEIIINKIDCMPDVISELAQ